MNHPRRLRALPAFLALLTGLTACGLLPTGSTDTTGTTRQPLLPETPRVAAPRDMRGIPVCQLLTPTQITDIGLVPTKTEQSKGANSTEECTVYSELGSYSASVISGFRLGDQGGLDPFYRGRKIFEKNDQLDLGVFDPGTLDGFPTLVVDHNNTEFCTLYIGVADDQLLLVRAVAPEKKYPSLERPQVACDLVHAVASAVLTNLPPLQ
jgi:hypothetical protein